jgi:hypothetical protein
MGVPDILKIHLVGPNTTVVPRSYKESREQVLGPRFSDCA